MAVAKHAICFDVGDMTDYFMIKSIPELCILPFDSCWFESVVQYEGKTRFKIGYLAYKALDEIHLQVRMGQNDLWSYICTFKLPEKINNDGSFLTDLKANNNEFVIDGCSAYLENFLSILSAINCTNVQRVENKPSEKLQKARVKRGKQPLFSYWTLHVDLDRDPTKANPQGGTHAAPRLHLRRGHARQYAPGKYCWVRACAVGNGKSGMVHKDYAVSPRLCASA